jgi:hypothetical protein
MNEVIGSGFRFIFVTIDFSNRNFSRTSKGSLRRSVGIIVLSIIMPHTINIQWQYIKFPVFDWYSTIFHQR